MAYESEKARLDAIDRNLAAVTRGIRAIAGEDAPDEKDQIVDVLMKIARGETKSPSLSPELAKQCLRTLLGAKEADRVLSEPANKEEEEPKDEKAKAEAAFIRQKMGMASPNTGGVRRTGVQGRSLELGRMTQDEARASLGRDGTPEERARWGGGGR
jgi:hypothetical protein